MTTTPNKLAAALGGLCPPARRAAFMTPGFRNEDFRDPNRKQSGSSTPPVGGCPATIPTASGHHHRTRLAPPLTRILTRPLTKPAIAGREPGLSSDRRSPARRSGPTRGDPAGDLDRAQRATPRTSRRPRAPTHRPRKDSTMQIPTAMKAIRLKCLDCSDNQPGEVRLCQVRACPLWPLRLGYSPHRQAPGSDRLRRWHEAADAVDAALERHGGPQNATHEPSRDGSQQKGLSA